METSGVMHKHGPKSMREANVTYEEAKQYGIKAAEAINQKDQARYSHWKDWFRRAIANEEHKVELQTMWDAGYEETRKSHLAFLNLKRLPRMTRG